MVKGGWTFYRFREDIVREILNRIEIIVAHAKDQAIEDGEVRAVVTVTPSQPSLRYSTHFQ